MGVGREKQRGVLAVVDGAEKGHGVVDRIVERVLTVVIVAVQVAHEGDHGIAFGMGVLVDIAVQNRRFVVEEPFVDGLLNKEDIVFGVRDAAAFQVVMVRLVVLGAFSKDAGKMVEGLGALGMEVEGLVHPALHLVFVALVIVAPSDLVTGVPTLLDPASELDALLEHADGLVETPEVL